MKARGQYWQPTTNCLEPVSAPYIPAGQGRQAGSCVALAKLPAGQGGQLAWPGVEELVPHPQGWQSASVVEPCRRGDFLLGGFFRAFIRSAGGNL